MKSTESFIAELEKAERISDPTRMKGVLERLWVKADPKSLCEYADFLCTENDLLFHDNLLVAQKIQQTHKSRYMKRKTSWFARTFFFGQVRKFYCKATRNTEIDTVFLQKETAAELILKQEEYQRRYKRNASKSLEYRIAIIQKLRDRGAVSWKQIMNEHEVHNAWGNVQYADRFHGIDQAFKLIKAYANGSQEIKFRT